MLSIIKKNQPDFHLTGLSLNNFSFTQGVVGKFNAKISNSSVGKKILTQYQDSVSAMEILIKLETDSLKMKISSPANVQYWINDDQINKTQSFLKKLFFKKIYTSITQLN